MTEVKIKKSPPVKKVKPDEVDVVELPDEVSGVELPDEVSGVELPDEIDVVNVLSGKKFTVSKNHYLENQGKLELA